METSDNWFRSYDYGFVHKGVCLWWKIIGDGRLHITREFVHQYMSIGTGTHNICGNIRRISKELRIRRVRYTVADKYSMGHRHSDDSGETRGDLFGQHGVPVVKTNHDRVQGWTRVREFLSIRPDGIPWLTIDPSCRYLIRTLAAATSDRNNPEDVAESVDDHALSALRYGCMSRPAPGLVSVSIPKANTAGRMLHDIRTQTAKTPYAFR